MTTRHPDKWHGPAVPEVPADKAEPLVPPAYTLRPLESRLRPPRPSLALVRRDSLLAFLAASTAPLTLVSAPAGAGKTTLLLQWFDESTLPKTWLTLAADADDPVVLLTYLALALGRVADTGPTVLEWLRLPAPPIREAILPTLAAALAAAPPFLVVLDDGQRLTAEPCWQLLAVLFEALPADARVAIATRRDPEIPLARLRAAGRLAELRFAELALNDGEATRLLEMNGHHADEQVVAALLGVTEGWAAGLYLAALSSDAKGVARGGPPGDRREVGRYLTSEVLAQQTAELRHFMLETSILERLCPDLCRAVTGRDDSDELLRRLAGENLFVWALDEDETWYRYHHLFAEHLQAELARRPRAEVARLHARAARWFEAEDEVENAVRHWLAAGEVASAAAVVGRIALDYLYRSGHVETVRRWLELFSDEQIQSDVPLTLVAGLVYTASGDPRLGGLWAGATLGERLDDSLTPDGGITLCGLQALLRAVTSAEGVTRMRADAELAACPQAAFSPLWRSGAGALLGYARWLLGDNTGARDVLCLAVREGRASNVNAELGALGHLSLVAADEDRWDEARSWADQARRRFAESQFARIPPMVVVFLAQARVLAHQGAADAGDPAAVAAAMFEQGELWPWAATLTATILAEVYFDLGEMEAAQRWTSAATGCLVGWPDAGILRDRVARLTSSLLARRGVQSLTRAESRVLELLPTQLSGDEVATRLVVSPNTVRSHVRAIYRKLGASSRTQAVERAREVGLLAK